MRVVVGLALSVGIVVGVGAQAPPIYPLSDARVDIAAATAAAKRDGKHVLLDFGADWCPDCRVLDVVLKDPAVAPFVAANFHIVRIDVGRRDRNADLVEQYRATSGDWIPAIVALDSTAAIIGGTTTEIRFTRRTTPAELVELLERWAPKRRVRSLGSFQQNGVRVEIGLDEDWRNQSWITAAFHPIAADVHLYGASLPLTGIDGLGRPTRLVVVPSDAWVVRGGAVADRREEDLRFDALKQIIPVYPAGPVTLRVPVTLRPAAGVDGGDLLLSYMGCSDSGCLPPVVDRRVRVRFR